MNRQDIVNELRDRGYVAEIKDVKKNGTVLKGIVIIGEANPTPIIYTDKIIENENSVSSIHELIIYKYDEDMDIEDFNYMVKEVNKELDPEDVLSDRVYVL